MMMQEGTTTVANKNLDLLSDEENLIISDTYIGEWKQGKADGYGVHSWANGDRYEGEWKICLKHGRGTDIFANGDKYTGEYKNGKPEGQGQYIWANGSFYEGGFKLGLKCGKGKWKKYVNSSPDKQKQASKDN